MVEQLLISQLFAVPSGTEVFDFDAPTLLYELVGFCLEFHHRRKVGGNIIRRPHLGVDNAIKRPAQLFDGKQTGQRILAIRQR